MARLEKAGLLIEISQKNYSAAFLTGSGRFGISS
jgi:hypothetical protein